MTHDQACKNLCKQIVSTLATCGNLRKEPDACGIFVAITCPKFLATILMLCGIFAGVQPLNLALQKSGELLVLADIPLYLDKTMSFLEKLKSTSKRPFSKKTNFNNLFNFFSKKQWHHIHQVLALSQTSNFLNGNNLKQMPTCHSLMHLWKKLRQHFHSLICGWYSTN